MESTHTGRGDSPTTDISYLQHARDNSWGSEADPFNSAQNVTSDVPEDSVPLRSTTDHDPNPFNTPAPSMKSQPRASGLARYPTRKIKLGYGSILSLDYPVPSAIQHAMQREFQETKEFGEEFSQLRYTAAVCDPDDFMPRNGYNLRPTMYNRHTELLIAMTYHNENKILTTRTLHSIMQNIRDISRSKSEFWSQGGPAWQKVVCTVVMDGVDLCDRNTLDTLATIGVYQEGIMKKSVDGKETVAHIFEYTTQLSVTENQELIRPHDNEATSLPPVQMILCIKHRVSSKINSHRWIFNGFCRILNPEVVVLLDAGTKPHHKSLLALWQSFHNDKNLGAAYGAVSARIDRKIDYLNPYVTAQSFEYEKNNNLEKPLESTFGLVSGGAFSAYRYRALMGRPLEQYFKGDQTLAKKLGKKGLEGMSILKKNMFFAGDRILSFETLAKRGFKWRLSFVKDAKCDVEVPRDLPGFMLERRQALNGTFAANMYALLHLGRIYSSDHGIVQMLLFHLQLIYNLAHFILSWFSLASFWLVTTTVMVLVGTPSVSNEQKAWPFYDASPTVNNFLLHFYAVFLGFQFILSLGNRPKGSRLAYTLTFMVFSVIQTYIVVLAVYLMAKYTNGTTVSLALDESTIETAHWGNLGADIALTALIGTYGASLIASILHMNVWSMLISWWADLTGMSCAANILMIYAFCNWHDVILRVPVIDNTPALPQATTIKDDKSKFIEEVDRPQLDIDTQFSETVKRALQRAEMAGEEWEPMSLEDSYKAFRTYLVLVWLFSNIILVLYIDATGTNRFCFTNIPTTRLWNYTVAIMWSVVGLSLFRFAGSMWFLLKTRTLSCVSRR